MLDWIVDVRLVVLKEKTPIIAARQIWALSNVLWPQSGFHPQSLFSNFSYILSLKKIANIPLSIKRAILWILWMVWKNRNLLFIEGKHFEAIDTIKKVIDNADEWFVAQKVQVEDSVLMNNSPQQNYTNWKKPPEGWLKCNIGQAWNQRDKIGGGAWVVRDARGTIVLHSRKSFVRYDSEADFKLGVIVWGIESMLSHHLEKVIFSSQ